MYLNKHDEYRALLSAKRNKRKYNLQHVYKEILDKQVEVKQNRQLKKRIQEIKDDHYMLDQRPYKEISALNSTLDCLPHEWNDPGMRYLRRSGISLGQKSEYVNNQSNVFAVNKSLDHGLSLYSDGKKTMLEPLQNYDTRKNFRKEMVKNYKQLLDDQLAHKEKIQNDMVEGNDIKMLEKFVNNQKLDSPIMFPGTQVGDQGYDKGLNRFFQLERMMNQDMDVENFDDDVFKRRNLDHIKNKELLKRQNDYATRKQL
jgi:hypothetical protein